jgi:hypothetical protein
VKSGFVGGDEKSGFDPIVSAISRSRLRGSVT